MMRKKVILLFAVVLAASTYCIASIDTIKISQKAISFEIVPSYKKDLFGTPVAVFNYAMTLKSEDPNARVELRLKQSVPDSNGGENGVVLHPLINYVAFDLYARTNKITFTVLLFQGKKSSMLVSKSYRIIDGKILL